MPANRSNQTIYVGPFSSVEAINTSTLYKPGELGSKLIATTGKEYQLVQLDSGATSATGVGVVAVGQLAYWKAKSTYLVTNDFRVALGGQGANSQFRNEIAGVFTVAATAGNYCVVQTKGNHSTVKTTSSSYIVGDNVVGDTTASTAQATVVTAGTAITVNSIGKAAATQGSGTTISVDLDIDEVP